MTLKENFLKPLEKSAKNSVDDCITDVSFDGIVDESVKIADEFAIGFADWKDKNYWKYNKCQTTKELLEIYKKEKGL